MPTSLPIYLYPALPADVFSSTGDMYTGGANTGTSSSLAYVPAGAASFTALQSSYNVFKVWQGQPWLALYSCRAVESRNVSYSQAVEWGGQLFFSTNSGPATVNGLYLAGTLCTTGSYVLPKTAGVTITNVLVTSGTYSVWLESCKWLPGTASATSWSPLQTAAGFMKSFVFESSAVVWACDWTGSTSVGGVWKLPVCTAAGRGGAEACRSPPKQPRVCSFHRRRVSLGPPRHTHTSRLRQLIYARISLVNLRCAYTCVKGGAWLVCCSPFFPGFSQGRQFCQHVRALFRLRGSS